MAWLILWCSHPFLSIYLTFFEEQLINVMEFVIRKKGNGWTIMLIGLMLFQEYLHILRYFPSDLIWFDKWKATALRQMMCTAIFLDKVVNEELQNNL